MHIELDTVVIIVNWNGRHLLKKCLQFLHKQTDQSFKIILVDNGSTDDSVDFVREKFPTVEIIELGENTGFAKGNNIGISRALEDENIKNIILLNNDTEVGGDFVEKLLEASRSETLNERYKKVGALAPKMLLITKMTRQDLVIDAVGATVGLDGRGYSIGHGEVDRGQYDESREVFGFCGGAVLLKREMLEDVVGVGCMSIKARHMSIKSREMKTESEKCKSKGKSKKQATKQGLVVEYQEYFDDSFFAYYEDSDLSWRMLLLGWKVLTIPEAVVYHLHSATADTIKSKTFKAYYLNRNRFLSMLKNYPRKLLYESVWNIPGSYFKHSEGSEEERNYKIFEVVWRKIIMIGVMIRVVMSLIFNGTVIVIKRKNIQKRVVLSNRDIRKKMGW